MMHKVHVGYKWCWYIRVVLFFVHVGYKSCWFLRVVLSFCAGVSHVGGDMFDSIPNGDAIFMKVN